MNFRMLIALFRRGKRAAQGKGWCRKGKRGKEEEAGMSKKTQGSFNNY